MSPMRDKQQTASKDRATQLLIYEKLSLAMNLLHDGSGSFSAYISEQNKSLHIVEIFRQTGLFKN